MVVFHRRTIQQKKSELLGSYRPKRKEERMVNIFFPELGVALVTRKHCPKGGRFIYGFGKESVYLVHAEKCPRGCKVAQRFLGGWNFADGTCVHIVYARSLSALFKYRYKEHGIWLAKPRQLPDGRFCGLIETRTRMPVSIGTTPVLAEEALQDE